MAKTSKKQKRIQKGIKIITESCPILGQKVLRIEGDYVPKEKTKTVKEKYPKPQNETKGNFSPHSTTSKPLIQRTGTRGKGRNIKQNSITN